MKFSAKSITLSTLITTSVISSMTFLLNTNQASARPQVYLGTQIHSNTMTLVNGNITLVGNLSHPILQTPCSSIKVVLRGTTNNQNYNLASTQASGSTIVNGCTYSLQVANYQVGVDSPNFSIEAVTSVSSGEYVYGTETFLQPLKNQINIQVGVQSILK
ncbi:hypothetical protein NIES22_42280 [Calothrix brevissima NIES-22]|nr:hypothetical protein NIES22_42280 [Calothrix brevissima NIES-22]